LRRGKLIKTPHRQRQLNVSRFLLVSGVCIFVYAFSVLSLSILRYAYYATQFKTIYKKSHFNSTADMHMAANRFSTAAKLYKEIAEMEVGRGEREQARAQESEREREGEKREKNEWRGEWREAREEK
jgi:hypothetical protein